MPPLLQSAQLKPDVTITSADSDDDIEDSDDERSQLFITFFILLVLGGLVPVDSITSCSSITVWKQLLLGIKE